MKDALERDTPPPEVIERARAAIEKGAGYELGSTSEEVISRMARGLAWLWLQFNVNAEPTTIDDECRRAARIDGAHVDTIHLQQANNEALLELNASATNTIDKHQREIRELGKELDAARAEINEQTEHADQIELAAEAREVDHRATLTAIGEALGVVVTPATDLVAFARGLREAVVLAQEMADRQHADIERRIVRLVEELDDARRQSNVDLEARRVATAERDNAIAIATENREALDSIARAVGADGKHDTVTYDAVCALRDQCSELLAEMTHGANPDALLRAISTTRPEPKPDEDGAEDDHEPEAPPRSEFVDRVIQATAEILADLLLEQEGRNT